MFREGGIEVALVVIVTVGGRDVLAADVDDCVAGGEEGGITGPEKGGWLVGGKEAEEVNGESFIGVEVPAEGV